jgi:EpsI family protein
MAARILVLVSCFLLASAFIAKASKTEPVVARQSLTSLPMEIDEWRGRDLGIDTQTLRVLGVDDYVNRFYSSEKGSVTVYAGFYQSQRQGNTIHSPLNCLPGAGWNPMARSYLHLPVHSNSASPQDIQINRILIEKGLDKQIVLYWYQAHGRVVANEYWGKLYTVLDAVKMNRTDGAMVRVLSPVRNGGPAGESAAEAVAVDFVKTVFPLLAASVPE